MLRRYTADFAAGPTPHGGGSVERRDPHGRHRRRLFVAFISLVSLAAFAMLAFGPNQPHALPDGGVLGLVSELDPADATSNQATSSVPTPASSRSPILEPIQEPPLSAPVSVRPQISVVQKPVRVAKAAASGAKVVFLGDSYTTGYNGAGLGARGWPRIVARAKGWRSVKLAVAGTGFLNPGWTNQPVGARVTAAIRQKPDVVFIAAGHNDSRWTVAATERAADTVIARLHRALPSAVLVIVAPIWPSGSPPARCLALRGHLRRAAASIGAIFIDPLAEGWFAGGAHRFIGPDAIHPTDAGHRYIAKRVLAHLPI